MTPSRDGRVGHGQKPEQRLPRSRTKWVETQGGARSFAERLSSAEGIPHLEAHTLREAVRWADVFGQRPFVTFLPKKSKKPSTRRVRNNHFLRCLMASKVTIAVVTDTLSESAMPFIGMMMFWSAASTQAWEMPVASVPITRAEALRKSASR